MGEGVDEHCKEPETDTFLPVSRIIGPAHATYTAELEDWITTLIPSDLVLILSQFVVRWNLNCVLKHFTVVHPGNKL